MNAMPPSAHPVLLMKVAKTNLACWCVGATAGTVTRMTKKEIRDVQKGGFGDGGVCLAVAVEEETEDVWRFG